MFFLFGLRANSLLSGTVFRRYCRPRFFVLGELCLMNHALRVHVLLCGQKNQKPPPGENRGAVPLAGLNGRLKRFCKQNGPVSPTGRTRCFLTARVTVEVFKTLPAPASARRSPSCGSALSPPISARREAHTSLFKYSTPSIIIFRHRSLSPSLHTQTKREECLNIRRFHQTIFYFPSFGNIPNIQITTSRMHTLHVRVVLLCGQKNQKPPPRENRGAVSLSGLNGRLARFCKQNGPVFPTGRTGSYFLSDGSGWMFRALPASASARRSPSCGSALSPRFPQGGRHTWHLFPT